MDTVKLVRMANRIGDHFVAGPDRDDAVRAVAEHLARYWEPRMRTQLLADADEGRANALSPLLHDALSAHRAMLDPRRAGEPTVPPAGQSEA